MSAFSWYFNGVPFSTDSLLVATESGTYQFYAENSFGCNSISEPLDLTLFDGVGTITAEVLLDINENGIIDAADSLLSGVIIDWASPEWGSGADTTNEAGLIVLPFQPAGNYELILDETSLGFPLDSALPAYDTTIVGCDNIYSFIWLLDPPACINTVNNLSVNQCAEEPFYFNGAEYESDTIITATFQSAAGCDSTVIASVSFQSYPVRFLDTVLCQGELLDWAGQTYSESGTYTDTLMLANTCDTIWEVTLSYMQPDTVPKELVSCDGEPVLFDGQWIAPGETVMVYADGFACDTVFEVTVEAAIIPEFSIQTSPTCTGSQTGELSVSITNIPTPQFSIDGISFQSSPEFNELPAGADTIYVQDSDGCISSDIFIIDTIPVLSVWADTFTLNCPGDELTIFPSYQISDSSWVDVLWEGGQNASFISVDSEGMFPLTVSNGCETYSLSIEVEESAAFEPAKIMILDTLEGCLDTLVLSGNLPNGATGIWGASSPVTIQNPSLGGALIIWDNVGESMVTWTLSTEACPGFAVDTLLVEMYDQDVFDTLQTISCEGDPIEYNGAVFNSDTTFTELYTSITGCDSTVQIQFSFLPLLTQSIDTVLCAGETFEWAGNSYSSSGVFSDTIAVPGSCDTVWNISLMYLQTDTIFQELISCNGESIQFEGIWIEPGDTVFFSPNSLECDTVYEVTVNTATVPEISVTAQPTCTGQQTGEITVSVNGIDAPQYSIDSINFQSTPGFNELPAGFNSVYVMDSEGCVFPEPFFIDTIPVLTAWTDTFSINCPGDLIAIHPSYQITDSSWVDIIWEDGQGTPEFEVEDSGTYPVIVTNGCEYFDMVIEVGPAIVWEQAAIFEEDTLPGCLDSVTLYANLPIGALGLWETDPASIITSPTTPATTIIWGGAGAGWATWSLSRGDCPMYSQDTVWFAAPSDFIAYDDQLDIPLDSTEMAINILENDELPGEPYAVSIVDSTFMDYIFLSNNGQFIVSVSAGLPAMLEVPYQICLIDCPDICSEATIRISVEEASDEYEAWNGFSPNGDGINETLVFDQLEDSPDKYPENELIVFNRWGDIVYRASPYQNDWTGTNQNGGNLSDGTYYYILRLDIGDGEIIKGDVTILR
jgi:gliding motility-associated-like protein